jgi:hypothetical protein
MLRLGLVTTMLMAVALLEFDHFVSYMVPVISEHEELAELVW